MKRTKIVCTIGPASNTKFKLKRLAKAGMNVCRLNFSHGKYEEHLPVIKNIRAAAKELQQPIAILQDLQGPRIRIGDIGEQSRLLKKNQTVIFTTAKTFDVNKKIPVTYKNLHQDIKAGERLLLVDGLIEVKVTKVSGNDIFGIVNIGGQIKTHKGINLPDTAISIPALTEKDKQDAVFGVKNKVDFMALSFVRQARDVADLREHIRQTQRRLKQKNQPDIQIIVKIERQEAVDNIKEIIQAADGVMVARGDLGIELPAEDVPLVQKMIIDECLSQAKPVIVATQMLDSMITNPRPTRAEVSDVANAVIDHADALMLSGETAISKYAVDAVKCMTRVIEKIEASNYDDMVLSAYSTRRLTDNQAMGKVAGILAATAKTKAILSVTQSGQAARLVSSFRPEIPHYAVCADERVMRQLVLSWGVSPVLIKNAKDPQKSLHNAAVKLREQHQLKPSAVVITVIGEPAAPAIKINRVELRRLGDL